MAYIRAWISLSLVRSNNWFPWQQIGLYWQKRCDHFFSAVFHPILFILADDNDMHENSEEFEIWPDPTTDCGVHYP